MKILFGLLFSLLSLSIAGCGGGGGGNGGGGPTVTPTQATVTVALSGTAIFGGATIIMNTASNKGLGTPTVTKIGIAATADLFAANIGVPNQVIIGLGWATGSPEGKIVTIAYPIAAGNFPQASDFTINSATDIRDINSQPLPASSAVLSVFIQ